MKVMFVSRALVVVIPLLMSAGPAAADGSAVWGGLASTITSQLSAGEFRTSLLDAVDDIIWAEDYGTDTQLFDAEAAFIDLCVHGENDGNLNADQATALETSANQCGSLSRAVVGFFRKIFRRCDPEDRKCKFPGLYCWYMEPDGMPWERRCKGIPGPF